jgi:hypothetical protein
MNNVVIYQMATRVGGDFSSLPLGKRHLARPEITTIV